MGSNVEVLTGPMQARACNGTGNCFTLDRPNMYKADGQFFQQEARHFELRRTHAWNSLLIHQLQQRTPHARVSPSH